MAAPSAWIATYTASRPSAAMAALYMAGERECRTGSPTMARTRLVAAARLTLAHHALNRGPDQLFQLRIGGAIKLQVPAERIAYLGLGPRSAGVLAEHVGASLATELMHPRAMVARHGQHQLGLLDHVSGQQPG